MRKSLIIICHATASRCVDAFFILGIDPVYNFDSNKYYISYAILLIPKVGGSCCNLIH